MVEAYATFLILCAFATVTGVVLWILGRILPETLQDRIWEKLGLGIKDLPPYDHTGDED